jgi:hypothetical protein
MKIKSAIVSLLCLLQFQVAVCFAQKDSTLNKTLFYFNAGAVAETFFLNKGNTTNISYCLGFSARQTISKKSSIVLMFNYQHQYNKDIKTELFDQQYKTNVSLSTSFSNEVIEIPLMYSYDAGQVSIAAGLATTFLFHTNITQKPMGDYGSIEDGIIAKYNFKDVETTAAFNRVNIAPAFGISLFPFKGLGVTYLLTYDLLKNPLTDYSYFSSYTLLNNKLLLTIKLN